MHGREAGRAAAGSHRPERTRGACGAGGNGGAGQALRRRDQPIAGGPRPSVSRQRRWAARQRGHCGRAPAHGSGRQSRASAPRKWRSRPSSSSPSSSSTCSDLMPESSSRLLPNDSPATEQTRTAAARPAARVSRMPTRTVDRATAATSRIRRRESMVSREGGHRLRRSYVAATARTNPDWPHHAAAEGGCRDRQVTAWPKKQPAPRLAAVVERVIPLSTGRLSSRKRPRRSRVPLSSSPIS